MSLILEWMWLLIWIKDYKVPLMSHNPVFLSSISCHFLLCWVVLESWWCWRWFVVVGGVSGVGVVGFVVAFNVCVDGFVSVYNTFVVVVRVVVGIVYVFSEAFDMSVAVTVVWWGYRCCFG